MQTLFNRYKEYKMERQHCHKSIPDTHLEIDNENKIDGTESSYTESPTVV